MCFERTITQPNCYILNLFLSADLSTVFLFKAADVLLWKDKKISAAVIGGATVLWVLFEVVEYHLLTLVSHVLIVALAVFFLWSNATVFIKK
jgi:hypothetical protein